MTQQGERRTRILYVFYAGINSEISVQIDNHIHNSNEAIAAAAI
jgi:hypothetical protein